MISARKRQLVEQIVNQIKIRYVEYEFSTKDIAKHTHFSKNYCERVFREVTDCTIRDYIKLYRLHAVKKLLETTDKKGYEIAYAVGYMSPSMCMTAFKKQFGIPMRQYRLEYKESQQWRSLAVSTS